MSNIKFISLLILLLLTINTGVNAQTKPSPDIEAYLKGRMEKRRIPGLQVAVVRQGKVVMQGSYGTADIQNDLPVTDRSVFSINSATKTFTGVAIMQLAEDGKIDINAPVSRYLDGLPPLWQVITLKQLVTHVSGLPDILDFRNGGTGRLLGDGTEESAFAEVQKLPMDFPTGTKYRYNQTNYVLLGKVIDKVTGKPFEEFIRQRQFVPAGMTSTSFGDSRDVVAGRAQSYRYYPGPNGTRVLGHAYDEFPNFLRTAGGINSTASDIARWMIALEQGKLLKPDSLKTLWTQGTFNDGSPSPWAIGWPAIVRSEHRAVAGIGGRRSAFFAYPDDDIAIVILTNLSGADPEDLIDEVAGHFIPSLLEANGGGLPPELKVLRAELVKRGFENAVTIAAELKQKDPKFTLGENDLNGWGYRLAEDGKTKEAIEVLKLNVSLYPSSANTYDSLAEAYETAGDKKMAIKNYRRSLELDPKNANAETHLRKLEN
jgi:CubicO group peptidase (beta-lactamase class C family)